MNASKQILTRINNLISHIEDLLENNLDIRRELVRIQSELSNPDVLRDINGIKVYKGSDYVDTTIEVDERIVIGEELDKSEVFPDVKSGSDEPLEEKEEVEGWNSSFYVQDCGGNIIPITEIPKSNDTLVNATFSVSND